MINFNDPAKLVRIDKYTIKEGDFYLLSISSKQASKIADKIQGMSNNDDIAVYVIDSLLCDENGNLLKLGKSKIESLSIGMLTDIATKCRETILGEKKS